MKSLYFIISSRKKKGNNYFILIHLTTTIVIINWTIDLQYIYSEIRQAYKNIVAYATIKRKCIEVLTGKALIYSNISLKLLKSCFIVAFPSTGLWNKNE